MQHNYWLRPLKVLKTVMATNALLKMFKALAKGSIITVSRGLYTEFTRYCEVLGTNVFPICQYSTNIRQYSSLFAIFCHLLPLFVTICDYSRQFITIRDYSSLFATVRHCSSLFATIRDHSSLFATIRHYSRLFVLFATIHYSGFPDTRTCVLHVDTSAKQQREININSKFYGERRHGCALSFFCLNLSVVLRDSLKLFFRVTFSLTFVRGSNAIFLGWENDED